MSTHVRALFVRCVSPHFDIILLGVQRVGCCTRSLAEAEDWPGGSNQCTASIP